MTQTRAPTLRTCQMARPSHLPPHLPLQLPTQTPPTCSSPALSALWLGRR